MTQAEPEGVLTGLQVMEVADFVAGPYAGRMLAEFGAEVIKIEPPGRGDSARRVGPFAHDAPGLDTSLLFNYLNAGKLGVTLDLSCASGRALLLRLLETADVFLYGGSVQELERLGLGYGHLSRVNPRLIGCYVTPFGLKGPYREYQGGELVASHLSGLAFDTPGGVNDPEKPPLKPGGRQALMIAGLYGCLATFHALFAREAAGQGQEVDVSELEPVTSFQFGGITRQAFAPQTPVRGEAQASPLYRAQDGDVAINPMQEYMWQAMVQVMGNPAWASQPEFTGRANRAANRKALRDLVDQWTQQYPKEEVYQRLQGARVPAFPNNTVADVVASPQVQSRDFFQPMPLPSGERALAPGPRYKFMEGLPGVGRPAPRLGEHTVTLLQARLGLSQQELIQLFQQGVV
ncbi:MAG: CoA transferase [Chloroflexi bacterium]|nr:CoA transferase [Chloroflexota bacterium]